MRSSGKVILCITLSMLIILTSLLSNMVDIRSTSFYFNEEAEASLAIDNTLYENGKIYIYNLMQLKAIGTNQVVKSKDDQEDSFSLGNDIEYNGNKITYANDADYILVNDIALGKDKWHLPSDFTGSFSSLSSEKNHQLYDEESDSIYLYNVYQLDVLNMDTADNEPVLSNDDNASQVGLGKVIYPSGSETYLTYSKEHNYILSKSFTSERPELVANQINSFALEDNGKFTNADLAGRDYIGQVYKEIDNKKYILIGNELQLRKIGTNEGVTPLLFEVTTSLSGNKTYTPYYAGDADVGMGLTYNGEGFERESIPILLPSVCGINPATGEPDSNKNNISLNNEYKELKYSADANYIIFRDIDLNNKSWKPLMFSGTMIGAKSTQAETKLWDEDATKINANSQVTISNINVVQEENLDTSSHSGIGFFGTISNKVNEDNIGVSSGEVRVENIKLNTVSIVNEATKIKDNKGLIGGILTDLGGLLGSLTGPLGDALDPLLNPDKNKDETIFATGAFVGRISGQVIVKNCTVENIVELTSKKGMVGGFAGNVEGTTEYGGLQKVLGTTVNVLKKVLNTIPLLDLGTLIEVLLDGNIIKVGELIPTGYYQPEINNCSLSGETLSIQSTDMNYQGGFVGRQVGAVIKNCDVKLTDLSISGKSLNGGFAGLTANAELVGVLDGLDVKLVNAINLNSYLLDCNVDVQNLTITSNDKYAGGLSGAITNSFVVDCDVGASNGSVSIKADTYAGGVTGVATIAQSISLGNEFYKGKKNLVSLLGNVLSGLLSLDQENTLLSLTGVSPSIIAGVNVTGVIEVEAISSYAGGISGSSDGVKIITSSKEALTSESFVWEKVFDSLGYEPKNRTNSIMNLQSVKAKDYAGGIVGNARTASAAGLLNKTLGIGDYLPFTINSVQITGISQGYSVSATNKYAGGAFGQAIGGNLASIQITNLANVTADNYSGGFVGNAGTGALAEAGGLNILGLVNVSNLLTIASGVATNISDCDVYGITAGAMVKATGKNTIDSKNASYYAGGFIGASKSADIRNAHVTNLKLVSADFDDGYAGGFCGSALTGNLADAVGNDTSALNLLGINGLLKAVPYLIPRFTNTTVSFTSNQNNEQVSANMAGGFIGELQSGTIDNSQNIVNEVISPYSVYQIESIKGNHYAGGFAGKVYSGGLVESDSISVLNGLNISLENLLGVLNVYIPKVKAAGVSSNGLIVEATGISETDSNSGSAGGFIGYGSGVQISNSNVDKLRNTKVTPPNHLNANEAPSYFDEQSKYAIKAQRNAGGYAGKLDIGSTAGLGKGLSVLGNTLQLSNVLSTLDVVASKIEHSDVTGGVGGYSVLANSTTLENNDKLGHAGGYIGVMNGSQLQDCDAYNFAYIIGQESAGGYAGTIQPGDVASAIGETNILAGLISTSENLTSILQSFIPIIYNSEATCIPCGGAVRAQGISDTTRARGLAGGYVGYNLGGRITGNSEDQWNQEEYTGIKKECAVYRLRSVYGYEFSGGFTGRMECANVVDTGSLQILFNLITLTNPLQALKAIYPTQTNTAIYGPLRGVDLQTWNSWVQYIGVNGSYGQQLSHIRELQTQAELDNYINQYAYGYDIKTGRTESGSLANQGGTAGGYVGRMDGGVITSANAIDLKSCEALRSSGGFIGEMLTSGVAETGGIQLAGMDVLGSLPILESFVPIINQSSVIGYQSGAIIKTNGTNTIEDEGHAGGYAGRIIGGQIKGTVDNFSSIKNLRTVSGTDNVGGYAGSIFAGSALDVNTNASSGLLSKILSSLLTTPADLAKVLNATLSTVEYASVEAWDPWGISVNGAYTVENNANTQYAYTAGGFAGNVSGAILGNKDDEKPSVIVKGLRSVNGGEHVGGFFGLADVSAIAQVGEEGSTSILNLIGLGEVDVLDAFRSYIYHGSVEGSSVNGLSVYANTQSDIGILDNMVHTGNAGGFGGSLLNGSVKDSSINNLNQVNALNYAGGFIGHMGKSGTIDIDKVQTEGILNNLLNATAGVLDNFGSHADNCHVSGINQGFTIKSSNGNESIAGGFVGFNDLARIDTCTVDLVKQVASDGIAGGFAGKTSYSYLAEVNASSPVLLAPVLKIVNELLKLLYLDQLENLGVLDLGIPGLSLSILSEGNTLSVNLLGLKISVALSKNNGDGTTDVAQIHIGDTYIELPCTNNADGNYIGEEGTENIKIGLIKSNRTKIENSSVSGINIGYDVFAGKASNTNDGSTSEGYAGGFTGYNNEGLLENNQMYLADTIRGTEAKVAPFTGYTQLDSSYDFNNKTNIEGNGNSFRIYRTFNALLTKIVNNSKEITTNIEEDNTNKWNIYKVNQITQLASYDDLVDAKMSDTNNTKKQDLDAYVSSSKAVLMNDDATNQNEGTTVPPPSNMQDPCDEKINLTINKVWKDFNNLEGIRPNEITFTISRTYVDGDETKTEDLDTIYNLTQGDIANTWQMIISDLDAYKTLDSGVKSYYTYYVTEREVEGYISEIATSDDGFTLTITNKHTPFLPDTGAIGTCLFTLIGVIGLLFTMNFKRRKKRGIK